MRSEKDVIVVVVVVVLGVAFICFPVVVSSSLLVNQVVVAFSVFLVILIDAIIDKIVDVKHTVKIFITFRSFFPLFSLCSRDYISKSWRILRPVQIGPSFCIPITGVCIPCAYFLEANANAVIKVVVRPGRVFGFCSFVFCLSLLEARRPNG